MIHYHLFSVGGSVVREDSYRYTPVTSHNLVRMPVAGYLGSRVPLTLGTPSLKDVERGPTYAIELYPWHGLR